MYRLHCKAAGLLLAILLTVSLSLTRPNVALASCYGLRFDYYSSPALTEIVGSMYRCPGYPDQHDMDGDGNYVVTSWYTVEQTICPCDGGGGGNGGDDDQDHGG